MYEADKVILELDGQGNETARNVYGSNLLVREVGNEQYYYMYNGHGDVTALLEMNGEISATYYYDAFGNITEETGEVKNPIRYAGYQYDEETGIYYLNARYYDPKIARFLTEDTYRGDPSDPLSLNLYTYCNNEPMMYTDPTGHWASTDRDQPDMDDGSGSTGHGIGYGGGCHDPNTGEPPKGSKQPNTGSNKNKDKKKDKDKKDNNDPFDKAIDKLKKEIEYRNYMGEYGLARNAEEILAQIEMLKNTIGQQKATNNWSYVGRPTASANNMSYGPAEGTGKDATFIQNLLDKGDKFVNAWLESQFGSSFGTDDIGAFFLIMDKDENGVYHANFNAWQQIGGYNYLYDKAFDYGTSMDSQFFDFTYNERELRVWAWKGDYINLGAGAEIGIYSHTSGILGMINIESPNKNHWLVDTNLSMPMTLNLVDNEGHVISDYRPTEEQWWITSFNPAYKDVEASNLTATYTINFSSNEYDKGMYDAFRKQWEGQYKNLTFDNYTVTFRFLGR